MPCCIRDARIEDLPDMLEIYNWAIRNTTATFDLEEQTLEQRAKWYAKYGGRYPLFVAEVDGRVAGYGCLSPFRDRPAYNRTAESSVYIHPEYFGRGIGSAIVRESIQRAKALGFHVLIAGVTAGNEVSERLHERFGFQLVGHFLEVGYKFGAWQGVKFYQLMLDE